HFSQQDNVDRSSSHRQTDLIGPSFQQSTSRSSPNHQEDDVDLEALVNDMNSSLESLYSTCSDSSKTGLKRSQPMHILAVRRLQEEEQQLRTSSLPAIPNPFPELCSPASSPVLSPGSLPPGEPSTGIYHPGSGNN
ncbi:hypothetical protein LDENG_00084750, partial [Lucifuga dentata]